MKIYGIHRRDSYGIWRYLGPSFAVNDGREFMFLEALGQEFGQRVVDDSAPDISIFYAFCSEQGLTWLKEPEDTEEFIFKRADVSTFLATMKLVSNEIYKRFDGKHHTLSICVWEGELFLTASKGTVIRGIK